MILAKLNRPTHFLKTKQLFSFATAIINCNVNILKPSCVNVKTSLCGF